MLDTIKFVRGAVSTKELVPVLTHFCIADGRLQGSNGTLTLDAPCPELAGVEAVVHAERFLKAVDACEGEPTIKIDEEKAVMRVSRKRFRAAIPLQPLSVFPRRLKSSFATSQLVSDEFAGAVRRLLPFMSTDASRPWSCSLLIHPATRYPHPRIIATANVVLARQWIREWNVGTLMLPAAAVHEIARIQGSPFKISFDEHAVQVEYENGTWFSCALPAGAWPNTETIENRIDSETDWSEIPDSFAAALKTLRPFAADKKMPILKAGEKGIWTADDDMGASFDCGPLPTAAFRMETLELVLTEASRWALYRYPAPIPFVGPKLSGVFSGVVL